MHHARLRQDLIHHTRMAKELTRADVDLLNLVKFSVMPETRKIETAQNSKSGRVGGGSGEGVGCREGRALRSKRRKVHRKNS